MSYLTSPILCSKVQDLASLGTAKNVGQQQCDQVLELKVAQFGQWLLLSWQSSSFGHQNSAVQIKSNRQLSLNKFFLLTACRKDENKEKVAGNGQLFF